MPKKNSKAALKKKQKKQKAKAKQQTQQGKNTKQNGNNGNKNGNKSNPKSVAGDNDVLKHTDNPDEHLKEFVRDINIHNFSRKQNINNILPILLSSNHSQSLILT